MEVRANAKLNLTLDVLGKRPDGYHDLRMIMQSVELADTLTLTRNDTGELRVSTNLHFLPNNEKNLAAQAALRWWEAQGNASQGLDITIDKHIPVCAGMAGGSSDAAAVLRALNELEGAGLSPAQLARIGERVGSDVPYCVTGGTALAEGRGEVLTPLPPLPKCWVVLCKPEFSISTPALFAKIDSVRLRCRPDAKGAVAALEAGDLAGAFLAVAAVNDPSVNAAAGREARARGILFNRSDDPAACDFFFPALCEGGGVTAGVVGDGSDHRRTAAAAQRIREMLQNNTTH